MQRTDILKDLVANGPHYDAARLGELAAELDMLVSDVLVVAGHPVPPHLLPPVRDGRTMRDFAYRVTLCNHPKLAALKDFVLALPDIDSVPSSPVLPTMADVRFPEIFAGLLRNRGFEAQQLPFTGLSKSTINCMLIGRVHSLQSLNGMAGPLAWTFEDLAAVAGEPLGPFGDCSAMCHHMGQIYVAAIRLTTEQLVQAGDEADRLSGRPQGAWRPVARLGRECPDRYRPSVDLETVDEDGGA